MTAAKVKQLRDIIQCFYCVRYATTTRSLARYSSYSLRSLFRFLKGDYPWVAIRLSLLKAFVFQEGQHFIAAVDEVVEGKSGKLSHGLSRFYSSIAGKPIAGVCFFGLSLIEVGQRNSYFIGAKQVVYSQEDKQRIAEQKMKRKAAKQRAAQGESLPKGRKKGSPNKAKPENTTASFRAFQSLWQETMRLLKQYLPLLRLTHLVADSAYGTLDYLKLAQKHGLHLVSRLASNTALYQIDQGSYSGKGRKRLYGEKWKLTAIEAAYLKASKLEEGYRYDYYQFQAYNKSISGVKLNIVVLKTIPLQDGSPRDNKASINVFFSDDLSLDYQTMIDYYSLRFQIEFHFRDAKQHFGLSDFKNYKENNLTNFVNLSLLMCLVSKILLEEYRTKLAMAQLSILDLKIILSARNTVKKLFKLTQAEPNTIFNEQFCDQFIPDDLINAA